MKSVSNVSNEESKENQTLNNQLKTLFFGYEKLNIPLFQGNKVENFLRYISTRIAHLDTLINGQFNTLLHHPDLQRLEASWRGLKLLTDNADDVDNLKIRMLNIHWDEVSKDLSRLDFDQSYLFKKIYSEEFDTPGGEPFGILLGDYYANLIGKNSAHDISTLSALAQIASAAFCPFIMSPTPQSFQLDNFAEFYNPDTLAKQFEEPEYQRWSNLRTQVDTRFLGLTLPRIMMRGPYHQAKISKNAFCFEETVCDPNLKDYLWGNACYAFGLTLINSYKTTGWFAAIAGDPKPERSNGLIPINTEILNFGSNQTQPYLTECRITEQDENIFSNFGFIPICVSQKFQAIFYSNCSIFMPPRFSNNADLYISRKLAYLFCASRFAHYVKIMGRNLIGSLSSATTIEFKLYSFLRNYLATNEIADDLRVSRPLQGAKVKVSELEGKPGYFNCILELKPRYQLEKTQASLTLITELAEIKN